MISAKAIKSLIDTAKHLEKGANLLDDRTRSLTEHIINTEGPAVAIHIAIDENTAEIRRLRSDLCLVGASILDSLNSIGEPEKDPTVDLPF